MADDEGKEKKGPLAVKYEWMLHCAIAYLRRVDGAGKPKQDGTKPLNFFTGKGPDGKEKPRYVSTLPQRCASYMACQ
jgi:hypothetical protein